MPAPGRAHREPAAGPRRAAAGVLAAFERRAPLSADAEAALWAAVTAGGAGAVRARHALVEAHLPLAAAIARRHAGHGVPLADLVQEGSLGLLEAAERFAPRPGLRFAAFAEEAARRAIAAVLTREAQAAEALRRRGRSA